MSHPWTPFLTYLLHRKTRERTTVTGLPLYPRLGLNLNTSILGPRKCSTTCASTLVASCPSPLNWTPFEPETIIGSNSTDSPSSASSLSTTIPTPSSARNCFPPTLTMANIGNPSLGCHMDLISHASHRHNPVDNASMEVYQSTIYPATSPAGGPGHKRWSPLPPRLKPHSRSDHHRLLPPRNSRRSGPRRPVRCIYASLPHATSVPGLPSPAELSLG